MEKHLTTKQVAEVLQIDPYTVRKYIRSGKLKAYKLKHWRVKPEDLDKFIERRFNQSEK